MNSELKLDELNKNILAMLTDLSEGFVDEEDLEELLLHIWNNYLQEEIHELADLENFLKFTQNYKDLYLESLNGIYNPAGLTLVE